MYMESELDVHGIFTIKDERFPICLSCPNNQGVVIRKVNNEKQKTGF